MQITEVQNYKWQTSRNTIEQFPEILVTGIQKYKLQKYRNTEKNDRNIEIQITEIKKYK